MVSGLIIAQSARRSTACGEAFEHSTHLKPWPKPFNAHFSQGNMVPHESVCEAASVIF